MTKKTKRIAWIAGLAGGAAAVIGVVAYTVSKSSSGSTKTGATLAPVRTPPRVFLTPSPTPSGTPIQTTTPPSTPQFVPLVPGQNATVHALAGLLTIGLPAGLLYLSVTSSGNGNASPSFLPPGITGAVSTQGGEQITIPLAGNAGSKIVVSGQYVGSGSWSTTISVQ